MFKAGATNKQYLKHSHIFTVLAQQMNSQKDNQWQSSAVGVHVCETVSLSTLSALIVSMQNYLLNTKNIRAAITVVC